MEKYYLLGHPIAHSISPSMHNNSFEKLGIVASYGLYDVLPEDLADAVEKLRAEKVSGFNLTMPHKRGIIPFLDELSTEARLAGAVNTVVCKDGKWTGFTTDGGGYFDSLAEYGFNIENKTMTILGAGGAATSIIVFAACHGAKTINVFKRKNETFDKTVVFMQDIAQSCGCNIQVYDMADMDALEKCILESQLLTNATNVGMGDDKSSLVPKQYLRSDLLVSDIIYHPAVTTLMQDAIDIGATAVNGEFMLLYQGARAFKLWTGKDMPTEYIKEKCFKH